MVKYILNDLKRALASKISKYYFFGALGLIVLANVAVIAFRIIYGSNEGTFSYNVFEYATWCFLIPYYSCIVLALAAVGLDYIEPYKNGIKVDDGTGRVSLSPTKLYIAKLIVTAGIAAVYLVVAFILLYVITLLFHISEGMIAWGVIKSFLEKAALSLPLWFAGISFAVMFLLVFEAKWKAFAGFAVITVIIPQLIRIFSLDTFDIEFFRIVRRYTITQSFGLVPYPSYPDRSVPLIITLGFVYGIIAAVVGIVCYNRKAK
ncbi:MAG: hypothetical protein IJL90_07085 [Lachnospiraceae bacterium]|nr:hypothetical protein [Lachnospiraceae bacterium]